MLIRRLPHIGLYALVAAITSCAATASFDNSSENNGTTTSASGGSGGEGGADDGALCPSDAPKTEPGVCGCYEADDDTDTDGTLDCEDECPDDSLKTSPGYCGCGEPDVQDCGEILPGEPSCLAILKKAPDAPSGVYNLASPDGNYDAYCDMDTSDGGWTLAMKIDGNQETFLHDQTIWENTVLLNPNAPDFDDVEAKLESFNSQPVNEGNVGRISAPSSRRTWVGTVWS